MSKFLLPNEKDSDIFSLKSQTPMIKDPQARIIHKENWKGEYYLFSLESKKIAYQSQPGQFIMVRIEALPYPLLRRPFSIHSRSRNTLEIFFNVQGIGTALLAQKKLDDCLDILGPLGKGFRLEGDFKGKNVWLVGGGRGVAPLYFLALRLRLRKAIPKIFYGGRNLLDLPLKEKFEKNGFDLLCSTDDGSFGFKGLVSDFLKRELEKSTPSYIYACGPEAMMKKIAGLSARKKIPAEFSLESLMGCGFGACWGCVRRIKRAKEEAWVKTCEEGPVFRREEIIWPEGDK